MGQWARSGGEGAIDEVRGALEALGRDVCRLSAPGFKRKPFSLSFFKKHTNTVFLDGCMQFVKT